MKTLSDRHTLRVYIEDTDYGGLVYHANYLKFFERARSEWAEKIGVGIEWQKANNIFFPVRYARVDYLRPARLHQMIDVVSVIKEIRIASIIYEQHIHPHTDPDEILCKAEIKIACVDFDLKPKALPENIFEKNFVD